MCTKNGSYCENEKKKQVRGERGWGGGCVQRMEVIVKMKKWGGSGWMRTQGLGNVNQE